MAPHKFSPKEELHFIETVCKYSKLYSSNGYDVEHSDKIWKDIGNATNISRNDCKTQWEKLCKRYHYERDLILPEIDRAMAKWEILNQQRHLDPYLRPIEEDYPENALNCDNEERDEICTNSIDVSQPIIKAAGTDEDIKIETVYVKQEPHDHLCEETTEENPLDINQHPFGMSQESPPDMSQQAVSTLTPEEETALKLEKHTRDFFDQMCNNVMKMDTTMATRVQEQIARIVAEYKIKSMREKLKTNLLKLL